MDLANPIPTPTTPLAHGSPTSVPTGRRLHALLTPMPSAQSVGRQSSSTGTSMEVESTSMSSVRRGQNTHALTTWPAAHPGRRVHAIKLRQAFDMNIKLPASIDGQPRQAWTDPESLRTSTEAISGSLGRSRSDSRLQPALFSSCAASAKTRIRGDSLCVSVSREWYLGTFSSFSVAIDFSTSIS